MTFTPHLFEAHLKCPTEKDIHTSAESWRGRKRHSQTSHPTRLAAERAPGQRQQHAAFCSTSFEELHAMEAREQC